MGVAQAQNFGGEFLARWYLHSIISISQNRAGGLGWSKKIWGPFLVLALALVLTYV